jgi:hypothetical protein
LQDWQVSQWRSRKEAAHVAVTHAVPEELVGGIERNIIWQLALPIVRRQPMKMQVKPVAEL